MSSCEVLEKELGEIDVVKSAYTAQYDRRFKANRPMDILFGKNKVETYNRMAPVREARYRKEDIHSLPAGTGIIQFHGSDTIFTI